TVRFQVPDFHEYEMPNGFLVRDKACHALFYYYLLGRKNYENEHQELGLGDQIVYEGELDPKYNYKQLFVTIANVYGVTPEQMIHHWPAVDLTCRAFNLPLMPEGDRYRFNKVPELKTQ